MMETPEQEHARLTSEMALHDQWYYKKDIKWPLDTPPSTELHRRARIQLLLAAYSYELQSESVMSDEKFDELCLRLVQRSSTNPNQWNLICPNTGNPTMDKFFGEEFSPHTGQWIHNMPKAELEKLKRLYIRLYLKKN